MSINKCVPATPELQLARLDAQVVDKSNIQNLMEQRTLLKPRLNMDALLTSLHTSVARAYALISRVESLFIDLDEVDDKDLEVSMALLSAMALKMRRNVVMKTEPVDASQPLMGCCSQVAVSESSVDMMPSMVDIWTAIVVECRVS